MTLRRASSICFISATALGLLACQGPSADSIGGFKGDFKGDSSVEAIFVDFEFDGELVTTSSWNPKGSIREQLLYTIGHLNGSRSVGRLDKLELSDVQTVSDGGKYKITYHAKLPVAWGYKNDVPESYQLTLPRDVSFAGLESFTSSYKDDCVDFSAHDVDTGSMWYYYRPAAWNCQLSSDDVVETTAEVTVSDVNTTGKYPEYDKVWEDDALKVVAVFGKYEDGATASSDAGIAAYNSFVSRTKTDLAGLDLVTVPADVPTSPGVDNPDITFQAALPDGRSVQIVALLVDNVRTAGPVFDARYEALSSDADLIAYNGHAGLGANIRALAQKGDWQTGQYAIVFMNGCDTYAYVDSALNDAHAAVNPDDPTGTKYVDIVTNALPAFFHSTANATRALVNGLMSYDQPMTYEMMFANIDSSQVVLVSGEHDNTYVPGGGQPTTWDGLSEAGTVTAGEEHHFETPVLEAGRYLFELSGDADADLYVRLGSAPTTASYDCRPFLYGSQETCTVDLPAPTAIHIMVRGWDPSSDYQLVAGPE